MYPGRSHRLYTPEVRQKFRSVPEQPEFRRNSGKNLPEFWQNSVLPDVALFPGGSSGSGSGPLKSTSGKHWFGDHALALLSEIAVLGLRQASSRRQNSGPPRAQMLPLRTGCASGSRRSLDGFRSPYSRVGAPSMSDTLLRQTSRASVYSTVLYGSREAND